jgi:hypothetical protein
MTVFHPFTHTTVHEGASTHDGLGRAALVRRFKRLKPSHKELHRRRTKQQNQQKFVQWLGSMQCWA